MKLKDIKEGKKVYTVQWAMYLGEDGNFWLNGEYDADSFPANKNQMSVVRTNGRYTCDVRNCPERVWERTGAMFVGSFLPILVDRVIS